jgi:hypothetical protein
MKAYEEIIDFIASGPSSDSVLNFQASEKTKAYVGQLIQKEKEGNLSAEELSELEHYMQLEHIMRLAKAKARLHVSHG